VLNSEGNSNPRVLGSLSTTWNALRAKRRILLGGVQPRGSQRKALEAKGSVILHGQDFFTSEKHGKDVFLTAAINVPENSKCAR